VLKIPVLNLELNLGLNPRLNLERDPRLNLERDPRLNLSKNLSQNVRQGAADVRTEIRIESHRLTQAMGV
jgi:hypothetical protein